MNSLLFLLTFLLTVCMATGASAERPGYVPDQVIVRFAPDLTDGARETVIRDHVLNLAEIGYNDLFRVYTLPQGRTPLQAARALSRRPEVVYAEPNYIARTSSVNINDPFFRPYQWNLFNHGAVSGSAVSHWGVQAEGAWQIYSKALVTGAPGNVTVAILDTGVAYENFRRFALAPDLQGTVFVSPRNYVNGSANANDDEGHGTHVCGTIAQATNNGIGVAGVFPGARIMPVKVLDQSGNGTYAWITNGIYWAVDNGASVINMSLSGPSPNSTLLNALEYATANDVMLVAAAGNENEDNAGYPAAYTQCIAVGATRFDGNRSPYSNFGEAVEILAPGGDLNVDQNQDGYGDGILQQTFSTNVKDFAYYFFHGTSMAAPHVSAVAALVRSHNPALTAAQTRSLLKETAKPNPYWPKDSRGVVDAVAALQAAQPPPNTPPVVTIIQPEDGGAFVSGESITFEGTAVDAEDGYLTETLVWTSSINGQIGTGGSFSVALGDGGHIIMATATDSGGLVGEASVTITAGGPLTLDSIGEISSLADGVEVRLLGKIVTTPHFNSPDRVYIQEPNRYAGIMVMTSEPTTPGDVLDVSGTVSTVNGERALVGTYIEARVTGGPELQPLAMSNRTLGGIGSGITGSVGLYNIGLLIRTWGKIIRIGDDHLYIDDGSMVVEDTGNSGVRVICDPTGYDVENFITGIGISSVFETETGPARRILTRRQSDIIKITTP